MPRPQLECVSGPHCGKRLFAPRLGTAEVRVPADPAYEEAAVRLLASLQLPGVERVGVYRVELHRSGDFVLVWQGEDEA